MTGKAVLLVEPSAYPSAKKSKAIEEASADSEVTSPVKIIKKEQTEDANLLPLIDQSADAKCRRRVIARIYNCEQRGEQLSPNPT